MWWGGRRVEEGRTRENRNGVGLGNQERQGLTLLGSFIVSVEDSE